MLACANQPPTGRSDIGEFCVKNTSALLTKRKLKIVLEINIVGIVLRGHFCEGFFCYMCMLYECLEGCFRKMGNGVLRMY